MHFSFSTITVAAAIFAAAEAAPHKHHSKESGGWSLGGFPFGGGSARPTGANAGFRGPPANFTGGRGGFGGGNRPTQLPGGGSGRPSPSFPIPTAAPTGGAPEIPNLSSISFALPTGEPEVAGAAAKSKKSRSKNRTRTRSPSGGFQGPPANFTGGRGGSGFGREPTAPFPIPTAAPTGGAPEVPNLSSVSFVLPSGEPEVAAVAEPRSSRAFSKSKASASATPTSPSGVNGTSPIGGSAASTTFPQAAGESTLSEPMVVTGVFDGGLKRFGRGVTCNGQTEGGDSDAVFQIEEGGTLKNVIIGADQNEGVHCLGACTIENVWWEAVCEDALTIKQKSGTSTVTGGGAKGAKDKVIQHNGGGTVAISGFYVADSGKLYRSCGNCKTQSERHVTIDNVVAENVDLLAGINTNFKDTAKITNTCATAAKEVCTEFEGNDSGAEPKQTSSGPSAACGYTEADASQC